MSGYVEGQRRTKGDSFPWGVLYQRPVAGSVTLGDLEYYEHHQIGSRKLAEAVNCYLLGRG